MLLLNTTHVKRDLIAFRRLHIYTILEASHLTQRLFKKSIWLSKSCLGCKLQTLYNLNVLIKDVQLAKSLKILNISLAQLRYILL